MASPVRWRRPQRDFVERTRVSGRHLLGLVEEVLDIAKVEAGQMRVEVGPVSAARGDQRRRRARCGRRRPGRRRDRRNSLHGRLRRGDGRRAAR